MRERSLNDKQQEYELNMYKCTHLILYFNLKIFIEIIIDSLSVYHFGVNFNSMFILNYNYSSVFLKTCNHLIVLSTVYSIEFIRF